MDAKGKAILHDSLALASVILVVVLWKVVYLNLLVAFVFILIYAYNKGGIKEELGFSKPPHLFRTILLAAGLALAFQLIVYVAVWPAIEKLTGQPMELGVFAQLKGNTNLLVFSLASGWIVGGLLEETIFRSFFISRFINQLPDKIGMVVGIILSSLLFGYLHAYQGPTGQILTGFTGLLLGTIYVINKQNIWLCILTHGFIDTISLTVLYFDLVSLN